MLLFEGDDGLMRNVNMCDDDDDVPAVGPLDRSSVNNAGIPRNSYECNAMCDEKKSHRNG